MGTEKIYPLKIEKKKKNPLKFLSTIPENITLKELDLELTKSHLSVLDPCNLFYLNSMLYEGPILYGEIEGDYLGAILLNIRDKNLTQNKIPLQISKKLVGQFLRNIKDSYGLKSTCHSLIPFNSMHTENPLKNFLAIVVDYDVRFSHKNSKIKLVIISEKLQES